MEIADLTNRVGIRDSKDKRGPALTATPQGWTSFIEFVRATHN